jgi:hypothetical protein
MEHDSRQDKTAARIQKKKAHDANAMSTYAMRELEAALCDSNHLVPFPVKFTRALYAQLTFKKFSPPRKYHGVVRLGTNSGSKKVRL